MVNAADENGTLSSRNWEETEGAGELGEMGDFDRGLFGTEEPLLLDKLDILVSSREQLE